ncbi:MAG TPA: response regulator [Puia sp.]|jgi:DNA-binding NtrC family response regulator
MQRLNIATLILDDDRDMLMFIEDALKENHITNYHLFQEDASFLEKIGENMHILVIDHHLNAGLTGLDVMARAIEKNPNVFVIAMSGTSDPQLIVDYLNGGCNRFILKERKDYLHKLVEYIKAGIDRFMRDMEFFRRQEQHLGFTIPTN